MRWSDLRDRWNQDPEHRAAMDREFPGRMVAKAVARLRAERGLTQGQLAEMIGTTQSVVARVESGRRAVNTDLLNRIASALDLEWRPVFAPPGEIEAARPDTPTMARGATSRLVPATDFEVFVAGSYRAAHAVGSTYELTLGMVHSITPSGVVVEAPFEHESLGRQRTEQTYFMVHDARGRSFPMSKAETAPLPRSESQPLAT